MEGVKLRRRGSTSTGCELVHVHGFSFSKSQLYSFSKQTGDFCYGVGSNVVVYDPIKDIQRDYVKSLKGLPVSSIEFTNDGSELFIGEYMTKEATVRHYTLGKNKMFAAKQAIHTLFKSIDGIAVSHSKTLIAIHGTVRNADKKDLK